MARSPRLVTSACLCALALCMVPLATPVGGSSSALAEPSKFDRYSPVAPVLSLLYAIRLNLKLVSDWLNDGDFDSAVETVDRVNLLLDLCDLQSGDGSWRQRVSQLRQQCGELIDVAKKKDASGSVALSVRCLTTVDSLEADLPKREKESERFSSRVPVRSFMKLLDASYTDAKSAKSIDGLTSMAYTIAETTHAAQFLRDDPQWRERASAASDAALKVAALNPDTDLKVARQELKNVYDRCQACHKEYKR